VTCGTLQNIAACVTLLTPATVGLPVYELSWGECSLEGALSMHKFTISIFVATVGLALLIGLIAP
jgi:hypothetical protein